jgi:quinol monooxygenase YgiN
MTNRLIVIAHAPVAETHRDAFLVSARLCIAETRKEAGCLSYDMHESVTKPGLFVFVEEWKDRAALDFHMAAPHLKAFLAAALPCLSAKPSIEAMAVTETTRLL